MPLQDYNINTRDAVAGSLYGLSYTNSVRHTYINAGAELIPFGVAVQRVIGEDRQCALGSALAADATGLIAGFSIRQVNREQEVRPGDGNISYALKSDVGVLHDGYMNVLLKAGAAVQGAAVHIDVTTGEIHGAAIAGTTAQATNVVFDSNGLVGSIVRVNITRAPIL